MKVYIAADMEGITGVVSPEDVTSGSASYERARRQMMSDVNTAISAAFDSGALEVLVNDRHGSFRNLVIQDLEPRARLISGFNGTQISCEGIDSSFDAACFIGFHAMHGTVGGVLNHTISSAVVQQVRLNGSPIGEIGLDALSAAAHTVPVVAISGDDKTAQEAQDLIPTIETAIVKYGIDRTTADCLPPAATSELIRKAVSDGLRNVDKAFLPKCKEPCTFAVDFRYTSCALFPTLVPYFRRTGPFTVEFGPVSFIEGTRALEACITLAHSAVQHG
ncbi:MAG TPA: M55 family metallopeptidase [Clostridiales bacterium]|jgi:D-amino peptidase|nr:M55 family metallopeptidase [Clostridiales bacterium]